MSPRPLDLGIIGHSAALGGAERSLLEMTELLGRQGVRCSVALPASGPLAARLTERGVRTAIIPYRWWMGEPGRPLRRVARIATERLFARRLAGQLGRWDVDAVLTNGLTVGAGALAAHRLGKPHVWYLREFGWLDHGLRFDLGPRVAYRRMKVLSVAFVANSRAVLKAHRHYLGEVAGHVLHQPVADAAAPVAGPAADDAARHAEPTLVMAAALRKEKGQEDAIRALARLAERGVGPRLLLLGGGPASYRESLTRLAASLGVGDRVELRGAVDDARPILAGADAVLNCSRHEAYGRSTVEAMRLGRPVVAAASGGTLELVEDGVTGLLYPPGREDALAERIERLVRDRSLAAALGRQARAWAERELDPARYGERLAVIVQDAALKGSPLLPADFAAGQRPGG